MIADRVSRISGINRRSEQLPRCGGARLSAFSRSFARECLEQGKRLTNESELLDESFEGTPRLKYISKSTDRQLASGEPSGASGEGP
jgi:hypothetical protein